MRTLVTVAAVVLLATPGVAPARIEERRVGRGEIAGFVRVERVERDGDTVRMRLANLTAYRLEHLRLIVAESFRWANERHPGADDPSRADTVTVREVIPPHGSLLVTHTFTARPPRTDGRFETTATVVGFAYFPADPEPRW